MLVGGWKSSRENMHKRNGDEPVSWRRTASDRRAAYLAQCDTAAVEAYDSLVGQLSRDDEDAYLEDLSRVVAFRAGMKVLDAGAGTGAVSSLLSRIEGLSITALEPAPAMLEKLKSRPELSEVACVEGFCDAADDRHHFPESHFDAIVSRQLGNELFDPLCAFANWHYWLASGGAVVVMDGLYGPTAWAGGREAELDELPLSACQTTAMVPYLLEASGFEIDAVQRMEAANARPSTRTTRYVVVARKP
jgi:SAM-dependent methyltransferase